MTGDLMVFLTARLDERERWARAAIPGPWHADGGSVYTTHPTDEVTGYCGGNADHIAAHDPARVLRDVAAQRAIIGWHFVQYDVPTDGTWVQVCRCGYDAPCATLRHLAAVYADHPDYQGEWRPTE
ncbi:hypothetical protein B4N89_27665 [Embleya scabrispora]|uniref:Uncharacterized protein n=1 Tax=Embleya scabrispora TaxID=159449 RepID=A0A1T3P564_9ACTN|nr:DUF6221 family protein [Embleya scabrispora]OPC84203.1 hypothetical protein B4N89_27665 [Embleya scabrispora]